MLDHYKTLGVSRDASKQEIKKAFRALAKRYHPDRNTGRAAWATAQTKRLLEAHRVLSHPALRESYDRRHPAADARQKSSPRPKRGEGEHPRAQAERILDDLLAGKAAAAMESYEKLAAAHAGYDLSHHLDLRDWVDCKFLIAEEYQRRNHHDRALAMYEELYHSEQARRRFPFFRDELRDRILHVCCHDAAPAAAPDVAAQYYLRALGLDLTPARKAFLHKKLAECHVAIGDMDSARRQLTIAFRFQPGLKGVSKICRILSFESGRPATGRAETSRSSEAI